jgi:hypothetical protein
VAIDKHLVSMGEVLNNELHWIFFSMNQSASSHSAVVPVQVNLHSLSVPDLKR